jgi:TP901-1 family phage major tail protein
MAAEKGRKFRIKASTGVSPVTYSNLGGIKSTSFSIGNELVDITDMDSNGWRELLADAGVRSIKISGSGVFKGSANETLMLNRALDASLHVYELEDEGGDAFSGLFMVSSLEYSGEHNGARQYSVTLESSGVITYTPAT